MDPHFINSLQKTVFSVMMLISMAGYGQFRKYSNEFMNIGAGARGLAMGGA
ncbi:hypothetical protein LBMAG23_15190 [Bacteroidota bacterium]|nr:hypothetical protein LBMAG23_15190 [Bacteroidota bacterium]